MILQTARHDKPKSLIKVGEWALNIMIGVIIKRGKFGHRATHTWRLQEDWSSVAISQVSQRTTRCSEKGLEQINPPAASQGAWPCQHLDLN